MRATPARRRCTVSASPSVISRECTSFAGERFSACRERLLDSERVDAEDWASLMNQNFDARRRIYGDEAIGSVNIDMVETARGAGAGAKLSGSGGAVLVCCPGGEQQVVKLIGALAAQLAPSRCGGCAPAATTYQHLALGWPVGIMYRFWHAQGRLTQPMTAVITRCVQLGVTRMQRRARRSGTRSKS